MLREFVEGREKYFLFGLMIFKYLDISQSRGKIIP
jgi:hypothetical protein